MEQTRQNRGTGLKRVSVEEIARDLEISRAMVYIAIRNGTIPSIALGPRKRIVTRVAYEAWLQRGTGDQRLSA